MASERELYASEKPTAGGLAAAARAARGASIDPPTVLGWVDAFLHDVGIEEPEKDEAGWRYLRFGGTRGRVGVVVDGDHAFLRVEAFVLDAPSDRDLVLPLHRELLELNFNLNATCRFAFTSSTVWLCDTRRVERLDGGEVAAAIDTTMKLAASAYERMNAAYGGTTMVRSGARPGTAG